MASKLRRVTFAKGFDAMQSVQTKTLLSLSLQALNPAFQNPHSAFSELTADKLRGGG
jgi:hypothetical protein